MSNLKELTGKQHRLQNELRELARGPHEVDADIGGNSIRDTIRLTAHRSAPVYISIQDLIALALAEPRAPQLSAEQEALIETGREFCEYIERWHNRHENPNYWNLAVDAAKAVLALRADAAAAPAVEETPMDATEILDQYDALLETESKETPDDANRKELAALLSDSTVLGTITGTRLTVDINDQLRARQFSTADAARWLASPAPAAVEDAVPVVDDRKTQHLRKQLAKAVKDASVYPCFNSKKKRLEFRSRSHQPSMACYFSLDELLDMSTPTAQPAPVDPAQVALREKQIELLTAHKLLNLYADEVQGLDVEGEYDVPLPERLSHLLACFNLRGEELGRMDKVNENLHQQLHASPSSPTPPAESDTIKTKASWEGTIDGFLFNLDKCIKLFFGEEHSALRSEAVQICNRLHSNDHISTANFVLNGDAWTNPRTESAKHLARMVLDKKLVPADTAAVATGRQGEDL